MSRAGLSWALRLAVSAAVLALLLWIVPVQELWDAVRRLSPGLWLGSVALFLLGHVVAASKWRLLMGRRDDVPPRLWLSGHFAGLTANLALPGVAGGDLVRAAWVIGRVGNGEGIAVASLVDRVVDLVALLTIAFVGTIWVGRTGGSGETALAIAGAVIVAGLVVSAVLYLYLRTRRLPGMAGRVIDAVTSLRRSWLPLWALLLSLIVQTTFVIINARLGAAAGIDPGFAAWLMAWPLAKLVATLPISLAGLGVREAALAAFMRPFGVPAGVVVAVGLLWETVLFAGGLVGWITTLVVPAARVSAGEKAAIR